MKESERAFQTCTFCKQHDSETVARWVLMSKVNVWLDAGRTKQSGLLFASPVFPFNTSKPFNDTAKPSGDAYVFGESFVC